MQKLPINLSTPAKICSGDFVYIDKTYHLVNLSDVGYDILLFQHRFSGGDAAEAVALPIRDKSYDAGKHLAENKLYLIRGYFARVMQNVADFVML